jgi:PAS domain S-box-containing protein
MKTETDTNSIIRRLIVVLEDSNDAITVHDLQGKIMAWNRGAEKMYGYTEAEALEMNIAKIVPSDKKIEAMDYLERIASGEIIESFETKRISNEGEILDVWLALTCLRDDTGAIDSIATTERDITEKKNELRRRATEVKILKGLLPICASCKQIRDDQGYWHQIESYIRDHSGAEFSHGICPECSERLYPISKRLYPRSKPYNNKVQNVQQQGMQTSA